MIACTNGVMTIHNYSENALGPQELLALPLVDLVEMPLWQLGAVLRGKTLPADDVLEALDHVLRLRLVRILSRESDPSGLRSKLDDLRRLVPHQVRAKLNTRRLPWSLRWLSFGDLLEVALESLESRDPQAIRQMAHCAEVLDRVGKQEGMSQVQLGGAMDLKPANISRILGILESNGLIRREAVGREKRVFLTTKTVSRRASTPTPLTWSLFPSFGHDRASQVTYKPLSTIAPQVVRQ